MKRRSLIRFTLTAVALAACSTISNAQVTGISYSFSPSAEYIRFGNASGLTPGLSFGGEVGFGFGEYLEVSGLLQFLPGLSTDWKDAPDGFLRGDLPDLNQNLQALRTVGSRDVNARRYGGRIRVNLGDLRFNPYVTAGTGVLRMSPDALDAAGVIYAELGVGATFVALERFTVSVGVQNISYRLNPASTLLSSDEITAIGVTPDDFQQLRSRNLGLVAAVRLYLAGRSEGSLTDLDRAMLSQFSGGNFRVAIEPVYGQINFNSSLGFTGSRAVAGLSAGFDLGPYIGIRGFYWRDTKQVKAFDGGFPNGFGKAQYYGGELQLRFDEQLSRGLMPFMILGGGFFDNNGEPDFVTDEGEVFDSRYFATAGGGIELPLGSALRLHGSVRGLFMSSQNVADVAEPSSVVASAMYTAGVAFNIGGSGRSLGRSIDERFASERAASDLEKMSTEARQTEVESRQARLEQQLISMQTRLDSVSTVVPPVPSDSSMVTSATKDEPAAAKDQPAAAKDQPAEASVAGIPANYISNERVVIPIPTVGEIYIRYGEINESTSDIIAPPIVISTDGRIVQAGGAAQTALSAESIREIVRQELSISQEALRKANEEAIGIAEERFSRRLATELSLMNEVAPPVAVDSLAQPVDSTQAVPTPSTADTTGGTASLLRSATPTPEQQVPVRLVSGEIPAVTTAATTVAVDTIAVDTMVVDTMVVDTMVVDTMVVDTMAVDTMVVDTMAVDTMAVDTMAVDTMAVDTVVADSVEGTPIGASLRDFQTSQSKTATPSTMNSSWMIGSPAKARGVQ